MRWVLILTQNDRFKWFSGMDIQIKGCTVFHPKATTQSLAALREISLSVKSGEQVAIIGPSGAGKTTFLHLLVCALSPQEGELFLADKNPWGCKPRELKQLRSRLFLAPQTPPLPPRQRVVTAVLAGKLPAWSWWQSMASLVKPTDLKQAHWALNQYDLSEKLFERVDRLSGGERQRVGLARALVSAANLFLIDEPLSALDPARADQAMKTLTQSADHLGATLVATLHQVDMALKYFPRVVGMDSGQIKFDLPSEQVTQDLLAELYSQHPDELTGPAPEKKEEQRAPLSMPMNCR